MSKSKYPVIGEHVKYVDPKGIERDALVKMVWLQSFHTDPDFKGEAPLPLINVVYVTDDADRKDTYGHQVINDTSVNHEASHQGVHGRFYRW